MNRHDETQEAQDGEAADAACSAPLVLLAPRVTDDSVRIWKAAIDMGWPVQRLPGWRVPAELLAAKGEVVLYAEPLFAEAVADQLNLVLLEPPPAWLPGLPESLRRRRIQSCSIAQARSMGGPLFVKPAEGKVFEARVYIAPSDDLPSSEQVDGALPVLVSEPVIWDLEVRCFVRDGQVVTSSPYWRSGKLAEAEDGSWPFQGEEEAQATAFASRVLADAETPPAFVLDVGLIAGRGWAVVEGNPCWGAGLYGCSPSETLATARRAIRRREEMRTEEAQWVSPRVRKQVG